MSSFSGEPRNCPRPEDVVDSTTPAATECFGPLSEAATTAQSVGPKVEGSAVNDNRLAGDPGTVAPRVSYSDLEHPDDDNRGFAHEHDGRVACPRISGRRGQCTSADRDTTESTYDCGKPVSQRRWIRRQCADATDAEGPPPGVSNSAADVDHPPPMRAAAEQTSDPPSGVPGPPDNVPAAQPGRAPAVPGPPEDVGSGVPDQAAGGR